MAATGIRSCCGRRSGSGPRLRGPAATPPAATPTAPPPAAISDPAPLVFTNGVDIFDPHYQTSYTDSWSIGFQRALGKDTSVEVRYIGNRTNGLPTNVDYNEQNI